MSQRWDARAYARNAPFVPALGEPVVALLAPRAGERILDLGCGDGVLTLAIAELGATVVGIDSSPELVAAALARGVDTRVVDAHHLPFADEFDGVFSNAALHWMTNPDSVLSGVQRALKPGGRFVGEFGAHGNVASICTALLAALRLRGFAQPPRLPWYFPTPDEFAAKLEAHGFRIESLDSRPRPTALPTGMRAWLDTFAGPFLTNVPITARTALLDDAAALLAPSLRDGAGAWTADYVRLRFFAKAEAVTSIWPG